MVPPRLGSTGVLLDVSRRPSSSARRPPPTLTPLELSRSGYARRYKRRNKAQPKSSAPLESLSSTNFPPTQPITPRRRLWAAPRARSSRPLRRASSRAYVLLRKRPTAPLASNRGPSPRVWPSAPPVGASLARVQASAAPLRARSPTQRASRTSASARLATSPPRGRSSKTSARTCRSACARSSTRTASTAADRKSVV